VAVPFLVAYSSVIGRFAGRESLTLKKIAVPSPTDRGLTSRICGPRVAASADGARIRPAIRAASRPVIAMGETRPLVALSSSGQP